MIRVLLTAGPTREYLDAVRYLSNRSSGRMGVALARAFAQRKATVTLVAGPCEVALPRGEPGVAEIVEVVSAAELFDAVAARFAECDIFVSVAAVADFQPATRLEGKRKKAAEGGSTRWTLELVPTADILYEMGQRKSPQQTVVGFALEAQDALANAQAKLERKRCDMIVLNSPANFGDASDTLTLLHRSGKEPTIISEPTKEAAAEKLVEQILALHHQTN